jgi:phosphatidylglycerophosphate synthase
MDPGRKLPDNLECPVDDLILKYIVDPLNPFFKSIGLTPNGLTAISGIFGVLAIYSIIRSNYKLAAFYYALSYIFDVFDGNFARKYNMVSKFGDWFDHTKDNLIIFGLIVAIYTRKDIPNKTKIMLFVIYLILAMFMCKYLTLQEKYYHKNVNVPEEHKSTTLGFLQNFFDHPSSKSLVDELNTYKHLGCGTFILYIVFALFYLSTIKK